MTACLELLRSRHSVRRFRKQAVPREALEQALEAARFAPTARNSQPWEFVVATTPDSLQALGRLADTGRFIAEAGACIAVLCASTKYYLEDGVAAVMNVLTCLHGLGLGACWVAGDKKEYAPAVLKLLGAPASMKLVALIPCGYPAPQPPRPVKRPLAEMVHWEKY